MKSSIPFSRLRVFARSIENCTLPSWMGSMLHGAFGHALKKISCPFKKTCEVCEKRPECLYCKIFEPTSAELNLEGLKNLPPGYVFRSERGSRIPAGVIVRFDLLLFGYGATEQGQSVILHALDEMCRTGLTGSKKPFKLETVIDDASGQVIWKDGRQLPHQIGIDEAAVPLLQPDAGERYRIRISLQSPLRIEEKGKLLRKLNQTVLRRTILRRFTMLSSLYGHFSEEDIPEEDDWFLIPLVEFFFDKDRYSSRQGQFVPQGGLIGEYILDRIDAKTANLLATVENTHLGKSTSSGLGQIKIESVQKV